MTRYAGMTLIEVLCSLALLSLLAAALSGWCAWAARAQAEHAPRVNAQMAARSVLRLIAEDIHVGDFSSVQSESRLTLQERVAIESGELRIRTRQQGPVDHLYRLEVGTGRLLVESERPDGTHSTRLLMQGVQSFDCALDSEQQILTIMIQPTPGNGTSVTRSYNIE